MIDWMLNKCLFPFANFVMKLYTISSTKLSSCSHCDKQFTSLQCIFVNLLISIKWFQKFFELKKKEEDTSSREKNKTRGIRFEKKRWNFHLYVNMVCLVDKYYSQPFYLHKIKIRVEIMNKMYLSQWSNQPQRLDYHVNHRSDEREHVWSA